eukprot:1951604-Prymnesium_polylepis.1
MLVSGERGSTSMVPMLALATGGGAHESHSYNESELLGGDVDGEVARLGRQVDATFAKELRHMRWYGVADGMRLLELGCGPGWSTLRFAEALPS